MEIHLHFGSIFQPAMLLDPEVWRILCFFCFFGLLKGFKNQPSSHWLFNTRSEIANWGDSPVFARYLLVKTQSFLPGVEDDSSVFHESMKSCSEGSQNYGHPKKKVCTKNFNSKLFGQKKLVMPVYFNYETRRAMPRWESPNLDINIAGHQHCRFSRQTAGWPVVRTLASMACQPCVFFCWATSRLCRLHMLNSWQWNSSSYRWRFKFQIFFRWVWGICLSVGCQSDDDSGDLCLPTPTRIDPCFGEGWIPEIYCTDTVLRQFWRSLGKSHKAFYKAYRRTEKNSEWTGLVQPQWIPHIFWVQPV